jgi:hypothetical protein
MSGYSCYGHANHNREVCLLLKREKKYDWVVTTAFYSCIHRLYDAIFPLSVIIGGKVVIFNNFTDYSKHFREHSNMGKHEILGKAVKDSGISIKARTAYESLKGASFTARYNNYLVPEAHAMHAISKLDIIDQECESIRTSRGTSSTS